MQILIDIHPYFVEDLAKLSCKVEIIDVYEGGKFEVFLYKCLAPIPFRKYRKRKAYLENATTRGFSKKLLLFEGKAVGQIEYAPAEVSGYPIYCDEKCVVLNCIWVLRKAKGHNFGKLLVEKMVASNRDAACFATISLEGHWSPWFKKWQMEKLGFKSINSMKVMHKVRHREECFKIHLMWLPMRNDAAQPRWNKKEMLKGVDFCIAHPLYRAEKFGYTEILEEC